MSKIDRYFQSLERRLRDDFDRRRAVVTDSEVKGHKNETAVGGFIEQYLRGVNVVYNSQIIDSFGASSEEIDICGCNEDQPSPETELIISEGVSFSVQVKAILDDRELDRIQQNADRVKRLHRRLTSHDKVHALPSDVPFFVERIPYFVLAFESKLSLQTALVRAEARFGRTAPELWPDGIFILERGAILSTRDAHLVGTSSRTARLRAMEFEGRTLMHFLQYLHMVSRLVQRSQSPLIHYFPRAIAYRGHEVTEIGASAATNEFVAHWFFNDWAGAFQLLKESLINSSVLGPDFLKKLQLAEALTRGEIPPEAFAYASSSASEHSEPIGQSIAHELSEYIRTHQGKSPELSPYPRLGIPFKATTPSLGKDVAVLLRTEFFQELQSWLSSASSRVRAPTHPATGLSWPPQFGH